MSDWTQGVVLVTGANAKSHGSGFVIERTGDVAHVVTCDHVVADLGEPLQVYGCDAAVVWRGSEAGVDLAILAVDGLEVDALPIGGTAAKGSDVVAMGWATIDRGQAAEPCHGTIESITQLTYGKPRPHAAYRIAVAPPIQDGYSGGPVIDVATGAVIAVITLRTKEGHAHAIAIRELRRWRSMAPAPQRPASAAAVAPIDPATMLATTAARVARDGDRDRLIAMLDTGDALQATRAAFALDAFPDATLHAIDRTVWGTAASRWGRRYLVERGRALVEGAIIERLCNSGKDALQASEFVVPSMTSARTVMLNGLLTHGEVEWPIVGLGNGQWMQGAAGIYHRLKRHFDDIGMVDLGLNALIEIFVSQRTADEARTVGVYLCTVARNRNSRTDPFSSDHRHALRRVTGVTAEALLLDGICDESFEVRRFAIRGLGIGGITRSVTALRKLLTDERVATDALRALARIGTPEAIAVVRNDLRSHKAVALVLEHCKVDPFLLALTEHAFGAPEAAWLAIRAIGVMWRGAGKLDGAWRERLFDALSAEPLARGQAALAIARVYGAAEWLRVQRAHDEAADGNEIVLTALGLCTISGDAYPQVAPRLREHLDDFPRYEPCVMRDVIEILQRTLHPEAMALAESLMLVAELPRASLERTRAAVMALGPP